jgi:hypothetical protein
MPEPIGGKEFRWPKIRLSALAKDVDRSASILGWLVILLLPFVFGVSLLKLRPWDDAQQLWVGFSSSDKFASSWSASIWSLVVSVSWVLGLLISAAWLAVSTLCLFLLLRRKNVCPMSTVDGGSKESSPPKGGEAPDNVTAAGTSGMTPQTKPADSRAVKPEPPQPSRSAPMSEAKGREAAEQELRERLKQAQTAFEAKLDRLKASIPLKFEFNRQVDTLDLGKCFAESGLKGEVRSSFLKSYLSIEVDTMMVSVNDPTSFCRDESCTLKIDIIDPAVSDDPLLREHSFRRELTICMIAAYPSSVKKFAEWASKTKCLLRLKNVRQGEPFSVLLADELGVGPEWATISAVQVPAGLVFDPEKAILSGLPEVGSDMKVVLEVECRDASRAKQEVVFLLTCNMDPELKWKEIQDNDSDRAPVISEDRLGQLLKMAEAVGSTPALFDVAKPDPTFSKNHRVSRRVKSGSIDMAYASIRGRSHVKDGSFREDDVQFAVFDEGRAVAIVVSDGAGSAPLSRRGSAIVAQVGVQCLVGLGNKLLKSPGALDGKSAESVDGFASVVRDIRSHIEFEADSIQKQRPGFQAKEMYATFLAALLLPTPTGNVLLTYSAGDGAIGLGLAGDASGLKCVPDHGQSAGQTLFILNKAAEDADKRLMFTKLPDAFALLIMSDGVSDPRIPHGEEARPDLWNRLAEELKPLVEKQPMSPAAEVPETYKDSGPLCAWLDSYEKGHHDDRTIAVLYNNLT